MNRIPIMRLSDLINQLGIKTTNLNLSIIVNFYPNVIVPNQGRNKIIIDNNRMMLIRCIKRLTIFGYYTI